MSLKISGAKKQFCKTFFFPSRFFTYHPYQILHYSASMTAITITLTLLCAKPVLHNPTGLLNLYKRNKFMTKKKIVKFTWYSKDMFRYMFIRTEFVTLVSLKVPSGMMFFFFFSTCMFFLNPKKKLAFSLSLSPPPSPSSLQVWKAEAEGICGLEDGAAAMVAVKTAKEGAPEKEVSEGRVATPRSGEREGGREEGLAQQGREVGGIMRGVWVCGCGGGGGEHIPPASQGCQTG